MADKKISELTDASPAQGSDEVPVNRTGVGTRKVTAQTIADLAAAAAASVTSNEVSNAAAALSVRVDMVSAAVSVISQQVSLLSQAHSALSSQVSTNSVRTTSVEARIASLSAIHASLSARSAGNVSTHGFQSIFNALSNRISATGAAASATSNEVSAGDAALSLRIASVNTFISGISSRSVGNVSTHGLQSVIDALSNRLSAAGTSVTSNEVSAQAASAAKVVSDNLSALCAAISGVSARSVGDISTHGFQSVVNALSNKISVISNAASAADAHASIASVAATSVDNRIASLSVAFASLSARSTPDASVHGFQSILNALSNRISIVSNAASAADAHASVASVAATSVNSRVNSVNTFISGISARSAGDVSTHGFQSVINALSNRISAGVGAASATSQEVSVLVQVASAAATSVNSRVNSVNTFISGISARSVGDISTHGFQSVVNALSNAISVVSNAASAADAHASVASVAATSVNSRIASLSVAFASLSVLNTGGTSIHGFQSMFNALSGRISAVSQAASVADAHASVASVAATSVDSRVASLSVVFASLSVRSVGNVSTHGFQSMFNALSNHASVISNAASAADAHASVASVAATSVDSRVASLSVVFASLSARSAGNVSTHGFQSIFNALSNRISGLTGGTAAAGATGDIQINGGGTLSADGAFRWDASANVLSIDQGTVVDANRPAIDISATWNSTSGVFVLIQANITDTASDTSAKLLDLQVGGATRFGVLKSGFLVGGADDGAFNLVTYDAPFADGTDGTIAIGVKPGAVSATSAVRNVWVGARAGAISGLTSVGEDNTALGYFALAGALVARIGDRNTGLGSEAIQDWGGDDTIGIGFQIAQFLRDGDGKNIFIGNNVWNGAFASPGGDSNVVIGHRASDGNQQESFTVVVGCSAMAVSAAIAIGYGAAATSVGDAVIGGNSAVGVLNFYVGQGKQKASPLSVVWTTTGGSGTDNTGAPLVIAPGNPTGSGFAGDLIIAQASAGATGVTLRGKTNRWVFKADPGTGQTGDLLAVTDNTVNIGRTASARPGTVHVASAVYIGGNDIAAAVASVDARVASLSAVHASLSVRSAGDVSTHGFQSMLNALSNRISGVAGGAGSATSQEISVLVQAASAAATSVNNRVASLSAVFASLSVRSVGDVSTHGFQSLFNALSNHASVLSNAASAADAHASVASVAATSVDSRVASLSVVFASLSVRSAGNVSTHGFQSILNALSNNISIVSNAASAADAHASVASIAATSVNNRVASLSAVHASLSVRSVGDVSTHGFQSLFDALSNRISVGGGGASATSQEISVLVQAASAAATSVNNRVASLSAVFASLSVLSAGGVSTHGFQSMFNALSNKISVLTGGTAAAGATGDIQFNGGGTLSADTNFRWNATSAVLSITGRIEMAFGTGNILIGHGAGSALTSGTDNTMIGVSAGDTITSGIRNTLIGSRAGADMAAGMDNNVFVGRVAGAAAVSGDENVVIGTAAGQVLAGSQNVVIGVNAGIGTSTVGTLGAGNVLIGHGTGFGLNLSTVGNVLIGANIATTGSGVDPGLGSAVAIGNAAVPHPNDAHDFVAIGFGAAGAISAESYFVAIGTSAYAATGGVALGNRAIAGANEFVVGGTDTNGGKISVMYVGAGKNIASPTSVFFTTTGGSGTDNAGGPLVIAPGRPTGSGFSGDLILAQASAGTTGVTLRTLTNRWIMKADPGTGATGDLLAATDNAVQIGRSASGRPGAIHVASAVYIAGISVLDAISTADLHASVASAAATSVDARIASLSVVFASVSALSVGVSTRGVQSAINALSNTISALSAKVSAYFQVARIATGAQASIAATTMTDISGLSLRVTAGGHYILDAILMYSTSTGQATGFGLTFPAVETAAGRIDAGLSMQGGSITQSTVNAAIGWFAGSAASGSVILSVTGQTPPGAVTYKGMLLISNASGSIQLQAKASTGTGHIEILPGSYVRLARIA